MLFVSGTRWAHKALNGVVSVQTAAMAGLAPFTTAVEPSLACLIAGCCVGLFAVLRRYERRVVLSAVLAGHGRTVDIETPTFYGSEENAMAISCSQFNCS